MDTARPSEPASADTAGAESEKKWHEIIEQIEDGFLEDDLAGNAVFFNNAYCRILGYARQELQGMNYREYMDKETAQNIYKIYNQVYKTGVACKSVDFNIRTKAGTERCVQISVSLIRDDKGHRSGFRGVVRDITDKKRAEQELEKHRRHLETVFQSVEEGIITVDTRSRVVGANMSAERICGFSEKEIVGRVFTGCPNPCGKACHEALRQSLVHKTSIKDFQIHCRHRHRTQQRVVVTSSPLVERGGKFMGAVLLLRDITKLSGLERELKEQHQFHGIIGKSRRMQEIYDLIDDLGELETTVLITGESGTGKELVARALHFSGPRPFKPFVTVNCSALAENLLESELFGHVRGAFTGAVKDKKGRFEAADGGTLLLDEIGDISHLIQLKLLRVLQEKAFERVGESHSRKVNVRVISSTNCDLKEKVRRGEFREDLYYRLKVVEIRLPALRQRIEDIPLLADHFCGQFNKRFNKNIKALSDEVMGAFMNYRWPGNIRELEHAIEMAFVLCRHRRTITLDHIPPEIRRARHGGPSDRKQGCGDDPAELLRILRRTDGNKAKAARLLGIDRSTLYRRIKRHSLIPPGE